MEKEQNQNQAPNEPVPNDTGMDSLEAQTTIVEGATDTSTNTVTDASKPGSKPPKKSNPIKSFAAKFNIYLLLFIFVLIIAGVVTAISIIKSNQANKENNASTVVSEPLSKEALEQLRQTDVKVGDPKQILSVESNAIFAGRVLVRGGLEVAGEIKAGAPLSLPGLTVSGTSILGPTQVSQLQVGGNTTIQGQLAVQNNLSVTGSGSFGGTLTAGTLNIQNLQLSGDLQFTKHIDAGGGTPGKSDGPALGGGGTSSVSGTDTAGTVAVNTGGGTAPGCFATINFTQRFNNTPHVVVSPVGSAGGGVQFYVNRTSTNFSICTSNAAPAGQSFAFDYIVID